MMQFPDDRLIIFAKAPIPGQVKKRLMPVLGAMGSAKLHQEMLEQKLRLTHDHQIAPTELHCWPDKLHPYFQEAQIRYALQLHDQQGEDLGQRMAHSMQRSIDRHRNVVLIGTDSPPLDSSYLTHAFQTLQDGANAVIGPAQDGGYILIGLSRFDADIFAEIEWGGRDVCNQTISRLERLSYNHVVLDTLWDVDRPEDLERLGDYYN